MDKIILQPDFVLIEKSNEAKTASGIAIPDAARKNLQKGMVIKSIGTRFLNKKVIYWINPEEPHYENDEYVIISEDYILAIL